MVLLRRGALVGLALLLVTGCSLESRLMEPLPTTFLEGVDLKSQLSTLPFEHSWLNPEVDLKAYKQVLVMPIRSDLLDRDGWISSSNIVIQSADDYMRQAREIANYFDLQLKEQLSASATTSKYKLVNRSEPQTIKIEIALTELEFGHPVANAGAMASPLPGTGVMVTAISDPHASFAARLTDAKSGQLLGTLADRKFSPTRIVDLNKFTVSSTVREICQLWSEQIAATLAGGGRIMVEDKAFDLMPY